MNQTRKKIEELQAKINPLKEKIYSLQEEEIMKVQRPRLLKMVGYCMVSTYDKNDYGKILDFIEHKDGQIEFILEICSITKEGNPHLCLDNVRPYTNKEWWDAEIPMHGWKKCPEEEYQLFKAKVLSELNSQKLLRTWIKKNNQLK